MKLHRWAAVAAAAFGIAALSGCTTGTSASVAAGDQFVGSEKCGACHAKEFATWKDTYHAKMVRPTKDGILKEVVDGFRDSRKKAQDVISVMLKGGTLVKVSEDLIYSREALERLRSDYQAYLLKEGKREGYPMVSPRSKYIHNEGWPAMPSETKVFRTDHPLPERRPERDISGFAVRGFGAVGAPLVPTGDAMVDLFNSAASQATQ